MYKMEYLCQSGSPDAKVCVAVDFSRSPWNKIHPDNLEQFTVEEMLRKCSPYPDGVFPGMSLKPGTFLQSVVVSKFANYIEHSKIVESDTVVLLGGVYMLSRYLENRAVAWTMSSLLMKEGKLVGYYIDGHIFPTSSIDYVCSRLYGEAYYSMVRNTQEFKALVKMLKDGKTLKIKVRDPENYISHNKTFVSFVVASLKRSL
jgi:hypothetical protein